MRANETERVCVDRQALTALKADGMGWGHDLDCGCFTAPATRRPGLLARLRTKLRGGV